MIYKFQPFSTTKELGKEYNAHCALVPNPEDWILILDWDVMMLSRNAYNLMEIAIMQNPQVEIFSTMTNRIGYRWQRKTAGMEQNDSVLYHMGVAREQELHWRPGVVSRIVTAGGFFLLFQKRYWLGNPFQEGIYDKRGKLFDYSFCNQASIRGSIAVIPGLYVWHSYRLDTKYNNTKHLL